MNGAVFLVHGLGDTARLFRRMVEHLERAGFETHALNLEPNSGEAPLEELAEQLARFIEARAPRGERIDLVGFSMGGLVSRYYVQRLGGLDRVRRLITISSPHRGTLMAYLRRARGVRQMRPGSAFLRDLNQDAEGLRSVGFTSIWTPFDLMIVPAKSSVLGIGAEVRVKVVAHAWMVRDRGVLRCVAELLSRQEKSDKVDRE